MKKYVLDLKVSSVERVNARNVLIKLTDEKPLPEMLPGQFVEVRVDGSPSTFLRRPISINFVDKERNEYVSIVPLTNSHRTINYYDSNFNKIKTYKIDAEHTDLNNNGAYAGNGNTIFTTLTTFVFVDEEGVVKNISPYTSGMEVEDMDYRNGQMYMAVNRKGKVEIYGLPSLPFSVNA